MSRKKPVRKGSPKNTALIYLVLAAIWAASSIVNFSQGYRPLAILYLILGCVFIVLAVINFIRYRNED